MVHPKYEEISVNVLFSYAGKTVDIGEFLELANGNSKITSKPMDDEVEVTNAINILARRYAA